MQHRSFMMQTLLLRKHLLAADPLTTHRLNANSFQQSAVTSHNGWQYCAFYVSGAATSARHVCLARRSIPSVSSMSIPKDDSEWETICFRDYTQVADDGHNTISIGICAGDGTIHVAFDHHCDSLHFRISAQHVATNPADAKWSTELFSTVMDALPGTLPKDLQQITYPRFVPVHTNLIFECRIGMAGEGSDVICHYSSETRQYSKPRMYLEGVGNNPYINGVSFDSGRSRLHVSWTYREFFDFDVSSGLHKQQTGPNGPENNRDIVYAFSDDGGHAWFNTTGKEICKLGLLTIKPDSQQIIVLAIPRDSGILNQEGQCVDRDGNFHILMRYTDRAFEQRWHHIIRSAEDETWTATPISDFRPTTAGARGSICSDPVSGQIYFLLPGNHEGDDSLSLVTRKRRLHDHENGAMFTTDFEVMWCENGFDGEPLYDEQLLQSESGILSVLTRTSGVEKTIVLLDFLLLVP